MPGPGRRLAAIAATAAIAVPGVAACSRPPPPKVETAKDQADATARARERAYGGDAVKALEAARTLEADLDRKAQESLTKAEK